MDNRTHSLFCGNFTATVPFDLVFDQFLDVVFHQMPIFANRFIGPLASAGPPLNAHKPE